jgi:HEPN domain-containing protein
LSQKQAEDYFNKAISLLSEAKNYYKKSNYDLCVRRSQDAFEMFLKSLFRLIDIEFPSAHDLKQKLYDVYKPLEKYGISVEETAKIILANETLTLWQERAFYGDEKLRVSGCFGKNEAELALFYVERLYNSMGLARYHFFRKVLIKI